MNPTTCILRTLPILALGLAILGPVQPAPAAMVGHWISGPASLADTAGYAPAGTHDGFAVGANAALLTWSSDVPVGFLGQSLDLSANSVAVLITNTALTDGNYQTTFDQGITSMFTVTFWYRGAPPPVYGCWVTKSGINPGGGWQTRMYTSKADFTMRYNVGDGAQALQTANVFSNDVWYHYAAVFNGTASFRKVYINGVVEAQTTGPAYVVTFTTNAHVLLGANQVNEPNGIITNFWGGKMYDVRIFNTPLSSNHILDVMSGQNNATISTFGLPGSPAVITGTNIVWTVPSGTVTNSLAPIYTMSLGATCDKSSGSIQDFSVPVTYTCISSDYLITNVYTVTVIVAPVSSAKDMLSFGPGAVVTGRFIRWLAPAGSDIANLAPTYTMSPLATGYPASGTTNDFTTPRTYIVVAQDLSSNIYTVTAVVPAPGWTNGTWTGDADSGITTAYPYIVAVNNNGAAANVNGIDFQASALSGPNFSIGGGANPGSDVANNVTSALAATFIWGANPRTVTLSSLTPGMRYKTTFFSVGWEAAGRTQTFNAGGGDVMVLDQDIYGNDNGIAISYQFEVDASGSKTFTITPVGVATFHLYALAVASLGSWQGADILTFGPGAVITGTNIAWTVPYGSDVTTLTPIFSLSEGATCDRTSGSVTDFTSPLAYTVVSADSLYTNVYTVTVTVTPASSAKAILTFGIPGNTGIIVGTQIALSVPYGIAVSMLAPTYTASPLATGTPPSGSTNDFTTPVTYTVTAQDLSTRDYTVTVTMRPKLAWPITNGVTVWVRGDGIDLGDTNQVRVVGPNVYVRTWPDQSGNGQSAIQLSDTNQPEFLAGDLNGYPTLRWDSEGKFMRGPSDTTIKTVFFVCKVDTNISGLDGMFCQSPDQDNQDIMGGLDSWREGYNPVYFEDGNTNATRINGVPTYYHYRQWHILRMVSATAPSFTYQLGQRAYGRYFNGRIAEFIAYNRALNDDEAVAAETYLSRKYWGGVYITNAPLTVTAGADIVVAGTNNESIVGDMWISNAANDQVAVFMAPSPSADWVSASVPSVYGNNPVWICGTNSEGRVASDMSVVAGVPEPATAMAGLVMAYSLLVMRKWRKAIKRTRDSRLLQIGVRENA